MDKPGELEDDTRDTGARSVRQPVSVPTITTTVDVADNNPTSSDEAQNVEDEARPGPSRLVDNFKSIGGESFNARARDRLTPSRELVEDLTATYFDRIHHAAPMLHQARYVASLQLSSDLQLPSCLRLAVMASGACVSPAHRSLAVTLYEQARDLAEADETNDEGESFITLAHAQCWLLLANFEARRAAFMRAAMSLGRARQLPGTRSRLKSAAGLVALPVSEEAFTHSSTELTQTLDESLRQKAVLRSPLAARALVSDLLHRSLMLAQESSPVVDERLGEQQQPIVDQYWSRHRDLDNALTSMFLMLPESLRLPAAFRCQQAVFVNILIHVAIICLHQSATRRVQAVVGMRQSRERMFAAAKEIQHIFGMVQDLEMALRNPMQDFAAYTAALVFLERLATDHGGEASRSNVNFLLDVLNIVSQTNPAAQASAVRLTADLERVSIQMASNL
ncbi:Glucose-repressible protein [Diaporthe amygdali]|uniref:Glucose-repressible protein n=1 Tax=Phomopsis amygdali TaxID=1214568 RepID=UPI0022FE1C56|nr:Glucose-repressible protein [Diaporthe amygdali]KAJ0120425.1 Glucose-repressible protein [Diaporthe amygdali]